MPVIECAVELDSQLGECPVWSTQEQVLYWVDVESKLLFRYDPSSGAYERRSLPGRPGSFVLTPEPGRLVVGMEHQLVSFTWTTNEIEPLFDVEDSALANRLNDGRCDPVGRYVVGTMWPASHEGRATGSLYSINPNGSIETLETGVGVPNGIAFDPIRKKMYFADTPTDKIWVWDYDAETGIRSNKKLFFDYANMPGKPDGGCVDAEGCYWSASVYGWSVIRVDPEGNLDRRIDLPVQKPSMPAFGGADMTTLFITTIGSGGSVAAEPARDGFVSGSLLAVELGIRGLPEPVFNR
jgi:L-arabinonolactonase